MYWFTTSYSLTGVRIRDSWGQLELGGTTGTPALAASLGQQKDPEQLAPVFLLAHPAVAHPTAPQ